MYPTASFPTAARPSPMLQFRHLVAHSNGLLITRLPASWVYALAWPHEIWHYLAARGLGLRAFIAPGATVFEPASRLKTAAVLLAPAAFGLALAAVMAGAAGEHGLRLALFLFWWLSGCLGDFVDLNLLARHQESEAQRLARSQRLLERYGPNAAARLSQA